MPAPTRTRVPVEKVTVTLPATLYREIGEVVRADGGWLSSIDFIREASRDLNSPGACHLRLCPILR